MFKALMRVRLASLLNWFTGASRTKKRQSVGKSIGFAALMLYALGAFLLMFYGMFSSLSGPYYTAGVGWLYFTMFLLMDFALIFIGSVFSAKAQLFEAKDNELLLSMPVPPAKILMSRMALLLIINLVFGAITAIPAGIAWYRSCPVTPQSIVCFVVLSILLPFFALAVTSLFGWLLSLITRRMQKKALASTVFSLIFLAAYFYFFSKANSAVAALAVQGVDIAASFQSVLPLYWMGAAIAEGSFTYLLYSAAILLVPFFIAVWLLSATFIRTVTTHHGAAKIRYHERREKRFSVAEALIRREASRFTSSSAYLMNAGLGVLFLVAGGIALPFFRAKITAFAAMIPGADAYILPILALGICLLAGMVYLTAASVSIEGNTHWITCSLPVKPQEVLRAKLQLQIRISLPAVAVAIIGAAIVAHPPIVELLALTVMTAAFAVETAYFGMIANLRHPFFNWANETQAVKNSMAIFVALFGGWAVVLLTAGALYGLLRLMPCGAALLVAGFVLSGVSYLEHRWVMTRGAALYCEA